MGSSSAKPEFVSVLADKQVKEGQDVTLHCEANTAEVIAKWEKNGYNLQSVVDKHVKKQSGTKYFLQIKNTAKEDEGNYTLILENKSGSASCSAMVTLELKEWRTLEWKQDPIITTLKNFKISNGDVTELRFLLHGPVGAGKSSIINSIKSIFEGRQFVNCLAASDLSGESFTEKYEKFSVGTLPFAFYDVMGLEVDEKKESAKNMQEERKPRGVQQNDIVKALKGHIPDNYQFQTEVSMSEDNRYYISNPTLNDKIHCLISVVAADKITIMNDGVIQKMKNIRAEASKLGIPQLVFMTRLDQACQMTQKDLSKIYQSKKVKEKMEQCSVRLGVPMNCIFPVKNYHEETKMNENLNCLLLDAFKLAVHAANDYVKKCSKK